VNPPRNPKGETGSPPPNANASEFYPNHVNDLADAHVRALQYLEKGGDSLAINLGTGRGHSLLEVIQAAENTTGRPVRRKIGLRRPGDPPVLWPIRRKLRASSRRAMKAPAARSKTRLRFPQLTPSSSHFELVLLRFALGGGSAIPIAYLSRRYFEERFLRLKDFFVPKAPGSEGKTEVDPGSHGSTQAA
jgi:hypothetical protein